MQRRRFLQTAVAAGGTSIAAGSGLLMPGSALAKQSDPFQAKSVNEVLESLGATAAEASDKIRIRAPSVAENGAAVPVGVTSTIAGTTEIITITAANPKPLSARYRFAPGANPSVESRFKMGKTTTFIAMVKADGKYYTAQTEIKVTRGGCGG